MSRAFALLLLATACVRSGANAQDDAAAGVPADCDGALVLALPELPLDLQPAPSGGVLIVDRGSLALRSEETFGVIRYLAPGIDGWHHGGFVEDGGVWRGETFDGHRYDVSVATGAATRLFDARISSDDREVRERSWDPDPERAFDEARRIATARVQAALEQHRVPVDQVPELDATASVQIGDELLLADITGVLWRIDLAAKQVKNRTACALCTPKVALLDTARGLLAIDRAGVAVLLSATLEPLREASLREDLPENREPLFVTKLVAVAKGQNVAWLASDGQHGLFTLERFAPVGHERAVGLLGVTDVAFWGADRIAYASDGVVEVRELRGGAVRHREAGNFASLAALPNGELLAVRPDGTAESLGRGKQGRCLTALPCPNAPARGELLHRLQSVLGSPGLAEAERSAVQRTLAGLLASRLYHSALSPDRTRIAFVGWADATTAGTLTVFQVEPWALVRDAEVGAQFFGSTPAWEGVKRVRVGGVAVEVPWGSAEPDALAPAAFELERTGSMDGGYERLVLKAFAQTQLLSDAVAGPKRRAELRRALTYERSPDGRAFIVGGGAQLREAPPALPSGSVEVFCAPRSPLAQAIPAPLVVPRVAELEGVLEIALPELPERYEALAAEPNGTAWVLGVSEDDQRVLARLTPEAERAEVLPLPSATRFTRLLIAGDGVLWALSTSELAKRSKDGSWTRVPFAVEGELRQAVGLPNGEVALVVEQKGGAKELAVTGATLFRRPLTFAKETPPLVALPDGVLVLADPRCSGASCERGFVVRDGKVDTKAKLISVLSQRRPHNVWLRGGQLILLGQKWVSVDVATGTVTEELAPQAVFRRRKHPVGPRPAPTPYLDSLEVELIRFVDRAGRPLALAALRGPAWVPEFAQAFDAVDTDRGTWARKGALSVMFWDGKNLRAYFHPKTREARLQHME